ncbi:protein PTCD3 homolog, mitochondrial-like [Panonychus citri]|uniref:protein PTCD3 homolog, mitochondrial-like n=1 Tax=Panonychus citri TaxID=50023 RepID=UPI0023073A01|nr:protein PTCD3 homolog, mitochondrial-like [Panonychus citri]
MANKYLKLVPLKINNLFFGFVRNLANSSSDHQQIIIPERIPRNGTDILTALSSTVGMDSTAPALKFIDDPFLIPNNRHQKLVYSLSKESGIKAAKFFMAKFPHLFNRDEAEPKVEAFHFKDLFDETMDLTEKDLEYSIKNNQVDNSITAFKSVSSKDGKISDDLKKNLLQLICYFNSLEPADWDLREKFISEKPQDSIWVSDFAFEVFNSIKNKDGEAFSIMIAGLCKHSSIERALQLYDEVKRDNISLTIEGYNAIISTCIREQTFENRWSAIMNVIDDMNLNKVAPNLTTFSNIFNILSRCKANTQTREKARGLMGELKKLKIEPSLGIFNDLLRIYTNGNNIRPRILEEILEEIGNKELTMRHEKDTLFFNTAMNICSNILSDVQLAYKLHDLVTSHNNFLLFETTDSEGRYYNNFFKLIIKSESIDKTMEIYDKYVPYFFVPDTKNLIELLETIEIYEADEYIPQICSDFIAFEYFYSQDCMVKFLQILSKKLYPEDIQLHVNNTISEILRFTERKTTKEPKKQQSIGDKHHA